MEHVCKRARIVFLTTVLILIGNMSPSAVHADTEFLYSIKFICGIKSAPEGIVLDIAGAQNAVQPGKYSTAINVHNFNAQDSTIQWRAVIAKSDGSGRVSEQLTVPIRRLQALEIDCPQIASRLDSIIVNPDGTISLPPPFIKGFVTITTRKSLNVVVVYTAEVSEMGGTKAPSGLTMDVEVIKPFESEIVR